MPVNITQYVVELPEGGPLHLQTPEEVELWNRSLMQYREDYVGLTKMNDLVALGSLLQAQIIIYRARVAINGMEPEIDAQGVPTGNYRRVDMDGSDLASYQKALVDAQKEMSRLEKQLGIDKVSRESGGAHTVDDYIATVKRAAHDRGIHVTKQVTEYQRVFKEMSWRVRMLLKADAQDRAYHNITPKTVIMYFWNEMQELEQVDQDFAAEFGKLYAGKL